MLETATAEAKKAHPATEGLELLVHNWGNAEAKFAWNAFWDSWRRIEEIYDDLYSRAVHREHKGKGMKPLWCPYCRLE